MSEQQGGWGAATPPPGWRPSAPVHPSAGLPPRPVYREPHRIAAGPLMAGIGATAVWFVLFGALGRGLLTYAWWTVAAAISAWLVATFLAMVGNRGVAVGVAIMSGIGLSIAMGVVGARWITTNDWPLW